MIVVVGAGVAGLTTVDRLASAGVPVTLMTSGRFGADGLSAGNTALAQGGIAAALGRDDSPAMHAADTVTAGAGLVDPEVAELLAHDGVERLSDLLNAGFLVDRDAHGAIAFGLEAAHSRPRVIHAGEDSSGAALSAFLTHRVHLLINQGMVTLLEQASLEELVVNHGRISGVVYSTAAGTLHCTANAVVLATGGYAGLFPTTSASAAVTGQGILAAARAGAVVADMEFIQFHPTVLPSSGELISEAVRGAGAVLRDPTGQCFMPSVHPDAELAPRDVVSRASFAAMQRCNTETILLDATVIENRAGPGTLARRFPQLTATLARHGIDWTTQYVPVAPAAHYCMGGLATDTLARTSLRGLFAAGEVAATGVHGANRLASNSLLEGLVFGARAAQAVTYFLRDRTWPLEPQARRLMDTAAPVTSSCTPGVHPQYQPNVLQELMAAH